MILRRIAVVLFLGLLGAAVVYSLMMAFGDPALELLRLRRLDAALPGRLLGRARAPPSGVLTSAR